MRRPWSKSDASVVRQVLTGDREAFGQLVQRHFRMAGAVAYAYTSSPDDADDAVQEAFLRAYRSLATLRDPARFGPWLAQIVRNACNSLLADRHRQQELAHAAHEPAAVVPDPARRELHQLVRARIESLDPTHREALLLHYFAGKRIREMAQLLDTTPEAVRKRLQRAREALGENLLRELAPAIAPEEPVSKRMRAVLAAVSAAAPHAGAKAAATIFAGAAANLAAAVGVACLTLLAWWAWPSNPTAPPPANPVSSTASAPQDPAPPPFSGASNAPATQAASTVAPAVNAVSPEEGDGLIICEVVASDGTPIPNQAVLIAQQASSWLYPEDARLRREARTNANGEAAFNRLPAGAYTLYTHTLDAVGIGGAQVGDMDFVRTRLLLKPAGRIRGLVRGEGGGPVPDARFHMIDCRPDYERDVPGWEGAEVGRADADGRFDIALPRGKQWRFHVKANGHATGETDWLSARTPAEIVLTSGAAVHARVEPAQPVRVRLFSFDVPADRYEITSDANGVATFEHLRLGRYFVEVDDPRWANSDPQQTVQVGPSGVDLAVAIEPGAMVSGRVLDGDTQEPVPDAHMRISTHRADKYIARLSRADAHGAYRFSGLPPGEYRLSAMGGGEFQQFFSDETPKTVQLQPRQELQDVDVIAGTGGGRAVVRGRVLDPSGRPLPNAIIRALVNDYRGGNAGAGYARSAGDGTFSVKGLPVTGDLVLRAFRPGLASRELDPLTVTADGLHGLELRCEPTGSVSGKIVGPSGRPPTTPGLFVNLPASIFWAGGADPPPTQVVFTGGLFRIPDVEPGEHELHADVYQKPGQRIVTTGIRLPDAVVSMEPGQAVTDVVLNFDDAAYARTQASLQESLAQANAEERLVRAIGVRGQVLDARTGAPVTEFSLVVGNTGSARRHYEQGRFSEGDVFRFFPTAEVYVCADHYAPQRVPVSVENARDRWVDVTVRLEPGAVVEGVVLGDGDRPVEGVKVSSESLPDDFHLTNDSSANTTGPDGSFRLDTLKPGPQRLCFEHPAYALTTVEVNPSRPGPVTVRLTHGGAIEGRVTLGGKPVPNARLVYNSRQGPLRYRELAADADGRYALRDLPPGPCLMAAFLSKTTPQTRVGRYQNSEVVVQEGTVARRDFAFDLASARIQGAITYAGAPAESVSVRVGLTRGEFSEAPQDDVEGSGGTYRTPLLPPGEASVYVTVHTPGGTSLSRQAGLPIRANETLVQDFHFPAGGVITGTVSGLLPNEDVRVAAFPGNVPLPNDADPSSLLHEAAATARVEGGAFRLEGLELGIHTLRVVSLNDEPLKAVSVQVNVVEGQEQSLNVALE